MHEHGLVRSPYNDCWCVWAYKIVNIHNRNSIAWQFHTFLLSVLLGGSFSYFCIQDFFPTHKVRKIYRLPNFTLTLYFFYMTCNKQRKNQEIWFFVTFFSFLKLKGPVAEARELVGLSIGHSASSVIPSASWLFAKMAFIFKSRQPPG